MSSFPVLRSLASAICFATVFPLFASHLCGGELYYTLLPNGVCELELHLYADATANPSTITIDPGDGSIASLSLSDIDTLPGFCCNYRLKYNGVHSYIAPGVFTLQTELSNRSADLLNIPNPTSQSLCISVMITIPNMTTANTSVRFTTPQSETYYNGNTLVHDVAAYDADGDSLAFALGIPSGANCAPMLPYYLPHEVGAGNDTSWLDLSTGIFNFQDPWLLGAHVLLIRCTEWRNGLQMGTVQRDMKLCVNTLTGEDVLYAATTPSLLSTDVMGVFTLIGNTTGSYQAVVVDAEGRAALSPRMLRNGAALDLRILANGAYIVRLSDANGGTFAQRVLLAR
ncbi:MAG: hypothetical protein ABI599_05170 [Flavobacteriales bacterium]